MIVVAVKSVRGHDPPRGCAFQLTPHGLLVPTQVLQRSRTTLERLDATHRQLTIFARSRVDITVLAERLDSSLGVVKLERLVAIGDALLVVGRGEVGVA
jgi:hypothetical protein